MNMEKNFFRHPRLLSGHLLYVLALLSSYSDVHATEVTIATTIIKPGKEQQSVQQYGDIKMPYVQLSKPDIARQINDHIYISTLQTLAPQNYVREIRDATFDTQGIADLDHELAYQNDRRIVLKLSMDACGAYCELSHLYFNFDLQTGRLLALSDILQPGASKIMRKEIQAERIRQYRKQIAQLENNIKHVKKGKNKTEIVKDLEDRISLNEDCLQQATTGESTGSTLASRFALSSRFLEDKLILVQGRCSNHAMRALDDVGDIEVSFSYASLRPLMTDYGRAVLLNETQAKAKNWKGQVLHGNIGKHAVTMLIGDGDGDGDGKNISGYYFYDKYRKPIYVSGNIKNDQLVLKESKSEGKDGESILQLKQNGTQLSGVWQGEKAFAIDLRIP